MFEEVNCEEEGESQLLSSTVQMVLSPVENNEGDIFPVGAVMTRGMIRDEKRPAKAMIVPEFPALDCSVEHFKNLQKADVTLRKCWEKVDDDSLEEDSYQHEYFVKNGLLYRKYKGSQGQISTECTQLVVPKNLRRRVLEISHSSILGAHMSSLKSKLRLESQFYWPGVQADTSRYVQSCEICQKTCRASTVRKAPLQSIVISQYPFQHIAIDLIGEITPKSNRGHRYILTVVDICTRYPEAIALKNIDTETVAEALLSIFSRTGVPERITSDCGQQFISDKMKEVYRLMSIKHIHSSIYHPMGNSIVERYNGSLKKMLKRLCQEKVGDWDKYIDPCLFAYRETPQSSTGYTPFELLGRTVRGPMAILKQLWTKESMEPELKSTYQYVLDLRSKIEETCEIARKEIGKSQARNKTYFDKRAKHRSFKEGEEVLILLSDEVNKMQMLWKGPYKIMGKVGLYDYKVEVSGGKVKTYHINLLKKFNRREPEILDKVDDGLNSVAAIASVIQEEREDPDGLSIRDQDMIVHYNTIQKESYSDIDINPDLSNVHKKQVKALVLEFQDIFTDVPKITNLGEHSIHLKSDELVQSKPYPIPIHMKEVLDKEIDEMLRMNIIVPSSSFFSSPVVMIAKPDKSTRVCINYKKLNNISLLETEPLNQADDIFNKLGGSSIYSKFDMSKGYWQVKMAEDSIDKTSFTCHRGTFSFLVMPFGLASAPFCFSRIMRRLLENSTGLDNYLDDVLAFSSSWDDHLKTLRNFFTRVRDANLAIKPSKCQIGYKGLDFLGHSVVEDYRTPNPANLNKIFEANRPQTKTQVKSFLGLTGFYQNYITHYSDKTTPLTNLLKKNTPNKVVWGSEQEEAFQVLKRHILSKPILKLPRLDKPFVLRTDSSNYAVAAVVMQEHDGMLFPVNFASKKLSDQEFKYPISQKEALAIIFGCQRFHKYLYGRKFILETDHRPLTVLKGADSTCPRLMRWALSLQPYDFVTRVLPGELNVGADFFSRHFDPGSSEDVVSMTQPETVVSSGAGQM